MATSSKAKAFLSELNVAINPVAFATRRLGYTELDEWQERALLSKEPRQIYNCCRQSGKTLIASILALHTALYTPNSLILILSPSLRQSGEAYKRIFSMYQKLGKPVSSTQETALTLKLANGSRILSLPSKEGTVRGFSSVSLIIIDEASRVPDELYVSVRPMLAVSQGRLILLSTPFGKAGTFYETWENGEGWGRYKITAYDCPRIDPEFLESERTALGDWFFRQEYLCDFAENEAAFFDYAEIAASLTDEVQPL
jgi:Terminase large subunit, T4likevirus-type, N-terminal